MQNQKNDPRPGQVSRPGDPIYDANPAANPGADDDFYLEECFRGASTPSLRSCGFPMTSRSGPGERAHTLGTGRIEFTFSWEPSGFRGDVSFDRGPSRALGQWAGLPSPGLVITTLWSHSSMEQVPGRSFFQGVCLRRPIWSSIPRRQVSATFGPTALN